MRRSSSLLALATTFGLAGCTHDHVVGRYAKVNRTAVDRYDSCAEAIPTAAASAVSIATPAGSTSPPPTALTLPEKALAAYIAALGNPKLSPSAADLRASLATPFSHGDGDDTSGPLDQRTFHRTIIVSVYRTGPFNPNDRLEATDVSIALSNARFDAWDTLSTQYSTINAGTVQLQSVRGATESLSLGVPSDAPLTASGTLGGSQTDTRTENFTATTQVETLTATVGAGGRTLTIHRQGGLGIDLTGNTVIKVDITYDENALHTFLFSVATYLDKKKKPLPPKKLEVAMISDAVLPPNTEVAADVNLAYTLRHVMAGGGTYEEKDDAVQEISATMPTAEHVVLIPRREASPDTFGIRARDGIHDGEFVSAVLVGQQTANLCFASYDAARGFLGYLIQQRAVFKSGIVGKFTLGFVVPRQPFAKLTAGELDTLGVVPQCL